jgi:hypothetical protein
MMKLSSETLNTLKNFAAINPNIVIKPGSVIKTMSESKTIMSAATVTESFPYETGIYDLHEFLGVVNMFDDPDLEFSDDQKSVKVSQGGRSVKYFFASPSILTSPSKDITMPPCEVTFSISIGDMAQIRKAAAALTVSDVVVEVKDGVGKLMVTDTADATSNSYEMDLANLSAAGVNCKLVFNIANFKFVNDDYDVSISSKLISSFKSKNSQTEYWVALEKNSSFGG